MKDKFCIVCGGSIISKSPQKYCCDECKVAAWKERTGGTGSPPGPAPKFGQWYVRKLVEDRMLKGNVTPDQVLKAIADLVVENEVLKKEVELLRAQLDYFKGSRTDLSNAKGRLPSDLLSNEEAAEYLRISPQTLATWRSQGPHKIPYSKVGRSIRYRVADLDAFLFRSERAFTERVKADNII